MLVLNSDGRSVVQHTIAAGHDEISGVNAGENDDFLFKNGIDSNYLPDGAAIADKIDHVVAFLGNDGRERQGDRLFSEAALMLHGGDHAGAQKVVWIRYRQLHSEGIVVRTCFGGDVGHPGFKPLVRQREDFERNPIADL